MQHIITNPLIVWQRPTRSNRRATQLCTGENENSTVCHIRLEVYNSRTLQNDPTRPRYHLVIRRALCTLLLGLTVAYLCLVHCTCNQDCLDSQRGGLTATATSMLIQHPRALESSIDFLYQSRAVHGELSSDARRSCEPVAVGIGSGINKN